MKKIMTKALALMIVFAQIINISCFAISTETATETSDSLSITSDNLISFEFFAENNTSSIDSAQIKKDQTLFDRTYLDADSVTICGYDTKNDLILYKIQFTDTIENFLTISEFSGHVVVDFYEGDKHDSVIFYDNGIKLNDQFFSFTSETATASTVMPRMRNFEYLEEPPSGFGGVYVYQGMESCADVELVQGLTSITVGGLASALQSKLFPKIKPLPSGLLSMLVSAATWFLQEAYENPLILDAHHSYRTLVYENTDSTSLDILERHETTLYSQRNFTGATYQLTYYYRNYFT